MKENIAKEKSYRFALRCINAYKYLSTEKKEFILSKQALRSGTSVGALIREAEHAQSKLDFISKMSIALKEANETEYWLMLLKDSEYISQEGFNSIWKDCDELIRLLVTIVKSSKAMKNEML
ncbi:MAG: four helix bundle protein [Tannerella sp.]|jgi:four helix bundle protein|nr:four helix bundle protein [Tannerella sp.]